MSSKSSYNTKSKDLKNTVKSSDLSYAIDIVELSKKFQKKSKSSYSTIKSKLLNPFKATKKTKIQDSKNVTVALKELTMRVPKGSSLGVIGRNGSGKSTLLKLITGIYKPDTGKVSVNGRLAALIELGAGFHPDFTGKENVYLAGAMYGLSKKEVTSKLKAIVDFAELSAVMDEPVRTYSSGMFMRLGFSVAIHIEPEVLLIDEVLAVGDEGFISKCKQKITDLRKTGKTLLLVSHDLAAVERWCDEVIWLHEGVVKDRGDPRRVIDHYRHFIEKGEEKQITDIEDEKKSMNAEAELTEAKESYENQKKEAKRWGSREIEITSARLIDSKGEAHRVFRTASPVTLEINYKFNEEISENIVFGIGIERSCGTQIYGSNTSLDRFKVEGLKQSGSIVFEIDSLDLLEGVYFIDVAVHKEDGYPFDYHKAILEFHVKNPDNQIGVWKPRGSWKVL